MKKFNIAYVPRSDRAIFSSLSASCKDIVSYTLSSECSLPHVTICQFYAVEDSIDEICKDLSELDLDNCISIKFSKYSNLSFDGSTYWMSILPDNASNLHYTFNLVSKLIKRIRTDDYDPHLTLFNYKDGTKFDLPEDIFPVCDEFELVIGESDDAGQMIRVISCLNDKEKTCSMF